MRRYSLYYRGFLVFTSYRAKEVLQAREAGIKKGRDPSYYSIKTEWIG